MAIQSHLPTHGSLAHGKARKASATGAQGDISGIFSLKRLPTYVLGFTIMAVVTLTERALDAVETGFALEWVVLSAVALLTFALLARVIVRGTEAATAWIDDYSEHASRTRADLQLLEMARRDPRVMNEILAAQGRAEAVRANVRLRAGSL